MGDWCGFIRVTNAKKKTGANGRCKEGPSFERKKGQAKKGVFFAWGGVFSLDPPFNG
jgi:hypothetical protein